MNKTCRKGDSVCRHIDFGCKYQSPIEMLLYHYYDVIMGATASQITSLTIVYSTFIQAQIKKQTSELRATGLCAGNSPVTGEFPAQMASNAENVSI